ncbi:M23 family metallopeptidase [Arenivirga flava]|uniref:M23 family metallopeptidase n=1 Tax=Arenivirga flava TaxID=1930060 RepID=UPI0024E18921|nr:M23 family metallopeptidase [Arenivirga flava]
MRGLLKVLGASALLLVALGAVAPGGGPAAASLANGAEASRWSWPIGPPRTVVRDFEAPPTPYEAGHRGIDLRAAAGTEVLAPEDGVVHFAGVVVDRPVLSIRHADGLLSSFEPVATALAAGDAVRAGEVIGTVADDGHCAGGCLHVGARLDGTEYVSPLLFLGGVPRAVLLPTRPIG